MNASSGGPNVGGDLKAPLPLPTTSRGRQTRSLLVDKAREIFEEKGYLDTVVADIAGAAGVAHGTFYKYFNSKQDIFRVLAIELQAVMIGRSDEPSAPGAGVAAADGTTSSDRSAGTDGTTAIDGTPNAGVAATGAGSPDARQRTLEQWWERVEENNLRYLSSYMRNAKLMAMVEQVATFNDEMLTLRRDIRQAFVHRSDRAIARLQAAGLAHTDVDSRYAANALGSMVDRFAYVWLVLGEDFELEESARTLTLLWGRAIGLPEPGAREHPAPQRV